MCAQATRLSDRQLKAVKPKDKDYVLSDGDGLQLSMRMLAECKVQWNEALGFFMDVLCDIGPHAPIPDALPNKRAMEKVQNLYEGKGRGSDLESARGTAWGLLNVVTEYVDLERRARSIEYCMDTAWFGQGAVIKQKALDAALQLVA
nr:DUF932 domain-containing protein [Pseudomonas sp. TNT2022 ID642]